MSQAAGIRGIGMNRVLKFTAARIPKDVGQIGRQIIGEFGSTSLGIKDVSVTLFHLAQVPIFRVAVEEVMKGLAEGAPTQLSVFIGEEKKTLSEEEVKDLWGDVTKGVLSLEPREVGLLAGEFFARNAVGEERGTITDFMITANKALSTLAREKESPPWDTQDFFIGASKGLWNDSRDNSWKTTLDYIIRTTNQLKLNKRATDRFAKGIVFVFIRAIYDELKQEFLPQSWQRQGDMMFLPLRKEYYKLGGN